MNRQNLLNHHPAIEHDEALAALVEEARSRGARLRYAATIRPGAIEVGPVQVLPDSPLYGLVGSDNMIVFETDRYQERPLAVSGPGAGLEVTAMGILGDILRIAAERR